MKIVEMYLMVLEDGKPSSKTMNQNSCSAKILILRL